jgi:Zn-finger nucleic acid-binding protein
MGVAGSGCRICGGFWFPGGHLTLLAENAPNTLADLDAQWPSTRLTPHSTWGTLWCPECAFVELKPAALLTVGSTTPSQQKTQPAGCPKCQGLWLDDGMLTVFQQQLAAGWHVPSGGLGTLISEAATEQAPAPAAVPEATAALPETEVGEPETVAAEQPLLEAAEPIPTVGSTTPFQQETLPIPTVGSTTPFQQETEEPAPPEPTAPLLEAAKSVPVEEPALPPAPWEAVAVPSPPAPSVPEEILPVPPAEAEPPEPSPVEFVFDPAPAASEGAAPGAPPLAPVAPVPPAVCVDCGTALLPGARFCVACGNPTSPEYAALTPAPARVVLRTAWPLWKETLQPLRPANWRTVLHGAAIGAAAGTFLGLLTLAIPGTFGKLFGLALLYLGSAAAAAFALFPESMARRSPEAHRTLLWAALTSLVLGLPLGLFFAPFMRPLLRGALTGAALVLIMERGPLAYKGCLRALGQRVRGTVQLLLQGVQRRSGAEE